MRSIEELFLIAAKSAGFGVPTAIPWSRASTQGADYATPMAFSLAKAHGTDPKSVAQKIASALAEMPDVKHAEVVDPGYINISMSMDWFEDLLEPQTLEPILRGKKYIIEYSSPNIAKPMHVGHLRTTILGQVLVNLYRSVGAQVVTWSHPGDWGVQFGKLLVAWQKWGDNAALKENPIDELLRVYVKFHQEAETHTELEEQAKATFKALQDGDTKLHALWQQFSDLSKDQFDRMYALLGVSFDVWKGESAYNAQVHDLVKLCLEKQVAIESEGAIVIPLEKEGLPPYLIQKSDGATLYATADLVSVAQRAKEYPSDELLYVVGNEQTLHFQQLFAAAHTLSGAGIYGAGFTLPTLTHVSYGFFRLTTGKMSTRSGEAIRLDELIDQAVAQASAMVQEKNADLPEAERETLAKNIGLAAVKYTDLLHDRHTDVVFDWNNMFSLDGNSIVYLFYTNARINSVIRQEASISSEPSSNDTSWTAEDKALAMQLSELNRVIAKCVAEYDPHHLLHHAYTLASDFSRLYNAQPILKAPTEARERRLALAKSVQHQLQFVFDLLNIKAPERL